MMKKTLLVLSVFLAVVICIGFFRGWFSLTTTRETLSNTVDVNLKLDADKMKQDATAVEEKTKSLLGSDK